MKTPGEHSGKGITVASLSEEQVPAVTSLLLAQQTRQREYDVRLRPARSREKVTATLIERLARGGPSLVALDAHGRVRGYGSPAVWELAETSILRAFLPARGGVVRELALPDPADEDAAVVISGLLAALSSWWQSYGTTGDLVRWPSADRWIEPFLVAQGFRLDSVCAVRRPYGIIPHHPPSRIVTRQARLTDEESLVDLFAEELLYHERYTPFVRCRPAVLTAFRRKLARLWGGERVEEGAPLVLVAQYDGEVVGMAETTLLVIAPDDAPGFTLPGRYGCIDNVSVCEAWRGQGIGHLLVQAVYDAFARLPLTLDGWLLWYNPDNPQAARFWPRVGFVPLWTTYQRLHPLAEG
ncbi:MAG: GNAT family N-acetyltransferase [Ktedonobacteraceae bacterium]